MKDPFVKYPPIPLLFYRLAFRAIKTCEKFVTDRLFVTTQYVVANGAKPDIKTPVKFSEKLQWLKLYDHKDEYTTMVDKIDAKKWVADRIGEKYIIGTLKTWDKAEDISIAELPEKFVLKCSHNSGGVIVCTDKSKMDLESIKKHFKTLLKENYFYAGREWPYKNVVPRVFAESFITENTNEPLTDYKFYCFNGEPRFLYISRTDPQHQDTPISYLDLDWNLTPFQRKKHRLLQPLPPRPEKFEEMLAICRKLAEGVPFLRVDLYYIDGVIYFSELTFFPASGYNTFEPEKWDRILGDYLELPKNANEQ